jgi:hypothetical protein
MTTSAKRASSKRTRKAPVPEALVVDQPPIDLGADPDEGLSLPGRGA